MEQFPVISFCLVHNHNYLFPYIHSPASSAKDFAGKCGILLNLGRGTFSKTWMPENAPPLASLRMRGKFICSEQGQKPCGNSDLGSQTSTPSHNVNIGWLSSVYHSGRPLSASEYPRRSGLTTDSRWCSRFRIPAPKQGSNKGKFQVHLKFYLYIFFLSAKPEMYSIFFNQVYLLPTVLLQLGNSQLDISPGYVLSWSKV